ncbi:hypothetical protein LIER_06969 [Lithospermum erythrorhizon]|uniref:Uncharacterized protein n=1 Tax=Lithospermum erythrorhizon TaxID=34254 RepID=A0AAV3P949_LITER
MEEVFLGACRGRTTRQLPWLIYLPDALFLSRKKETSFTDMDIFGSQFPYFNLVGNSISFDMSLKNLVWQCQSKRKSRAASRGNELTRSIELHDAEFSPCPLPLMNESDRTKTRSLIKRRPTLVY